MFKILLIFFSQAFLALASDPFNAQPNNLPIQYRGCFIVNNYIVPGESYPRAPEITANPSSHGNFPLNSSYRTFSKILTELSQDTINCEEIKSLASNGAQHIRFLKGELIKSGAQDTQPFFQEASFSQDFNNFPLLEELENSFNQILQNTNIFSFSMNEIESLSLQGLSQISSLRKMFKDFSQEKPILYNQMNMLSAPSYPQVNLPEEPLKEEYESPKSQVNSLEKFFLENKEKRQKRISQIVEKQKNDWRKIASKVKKFFGIEKTPAEVRASYNSYIKEWGKKVPKSLKKI